MQSISLSVAGMSCRRCVREVTAKLRDVPGVVTVSADAARSIILVSGTMQLPDVLVAFNGSGFAPTLLPIAATTVRHTDQPDRTTE